MIKRRKDLEKEFCRWIEPWLTVWQVNRRIYQVAFILHPTFTGHLRIMWGKQWRRPFFYWLKNPIAKWFELPGVRSDAPLK